MDDREEVHAASVRRSHLAAPRDVMRARESFESITIQLYICVCVCMCCFFDRLYNCGSAACVYIMRGILRRGLGAYKCELRNLFVYSWNAEKLMELKYLLKSFISFLQSFHYVFVKCLLNYF